MILAPGVVPDQNHRDGRDGHGPARGDDGSQHPLALCLLLLDPDTDGRVRIAVESHACELYDPGFVEGAPIVTDHHAAAHAAGDAAGDAAVDGTDGGAAAMMRAHDDRAGYYHHRNPVGYRPMIRAVPSLSCRRELRASCAVHNSAQQHRILGCWHSSRGFIDAILYDMYSYTCIGAPTCRSVKSYRTVHTLSLVGGSDLLYRYPVPDTPIRIPVLRMNTEHAQSIKWLFDPGRFQ